MPPVRASNRNKTPNVTPNSTKRILSPESQAINETQANKKNKTIKMTSNEMNELKEMLGTLTKTLTEKIDQSQKSLEQKFTNLDSKFVNLAEKVNTEVKEIKTTVSEFHNIISSKIETMNSTLKQHTYRLDNNDDDMQRIQLSQDVRLVGFAVEDNEDLVGIFRNLANHIGYSAGDNIGLPLIERITRKNRATGQIMPTPTLLIHFNSLRQKQIFYSLYLNKMPLNPTDLGLSSDNRIFIGENLTWRNAQLFKSAQIHRKNGKIAQTFTENGIVKIRFVKGKNEQTYTIRNQTELEEIVASQCAQSQAHAVNVTTPHASSTSLLNNTRTHIDNNSMANGSTQPTHGESVQISPEEARQMMKELDEKRIQQLKQQDPQSYQLYLQQHGKSSNSSASNGSQQQHNNGAHQRMDDA